MAAGSESGITSENRLTGAYLIVALIALFGGVVTGLFQAMNYGGHDVFPALQPVIKSYYHGLSIHGVLNVLVWTTFFICGFLQFITARSLGAPLAVRALGWPVFWLMTGGLILAAIPLVLNEATVLFTFYPPLQAHWAFYVGLTLVVVGTWLVMVNLAMSVGVWKRGHPGQRTPLPAFMSLVTFVMWTVASLGITAEMLFMMIPWSLGLIPGTNPLMARTLFWFTGHPIVYFWLLPAYVSWYTIIPKQAGGRLFSDPMARASFLLFLLLSTPVGFHHQFTDPGIGEGWKFFHAILTFGVFFPSLLTFFNVVSSLESGARARGGKGYFAWFLKLPWGNPSLAAQVFAMLLFCFGGIGGAHQRLGGDEPLRPQHRLDRRAFPPHGGRGGHALVHGNHLLARSDSERPAALEPGAGARTGLALVRRDDRLLEHAPPPRNDGHAPADDDERGPLHDARVESTASAGGDRRSYPVPERLAVLPEPRDDGLGFLRQRRRAA